MKKFIKTFICIIISIFAFNVCALTNEELLESISETIITYDFEEYINISESLFNDTYVPSERVQKILEENDLKLGHFEGGGADIGLTTGAAYSIETTSGQKIGYAEFTVKIPLTINVYGKNLDEELKDYINKTYTFGNLTYTLSYDGYATININDWSSTLLVRNDMKIYDTFITPNSDFDMMYNESILNFYNENMYLTDETDKTIQLFPEIITMDKKVELSQFINSIENHYTYNGLEMSLQEKVATLNTDDFSVMLDIRSGGYSEKGGMLNIIYKDGYAAHIDGPVYFESVIDVTINNDSELAIKEFLKNKYNLTSGYVIEQDEITGDKYLKIGDKYHKLNIHVPSAEEILLNLPNEYDVLMAQTFYNNHWKNSPIHIEYINYDFSNYPFNELYILEKNNKYYLILDGLEKEVTINFAEVDIPNLNEIINKLHTKIVTYDFEEYFSISNSMGWSYDLGEKSVKSMHISTFKPCAEDQALLDKYKLKLGEPIGYGGSGGRNGSTYILVTIDNVAVEEVSFSVEIPIDIKIEGNNVEEELNNYINSNYTFGKLQHSLNYDSEIQDYYLMVGANYMPINISFTKDLYDTLFDYSEEVEILITDNLSINRIKINEYYYKEYYYEFSSGRTINICSLCTPNEFKQMDKKEELNQFIQGLKTSYEYDGINSSLEETLTSLGTEDFKVELSVRIGSYAETGGILNILYKNGYAANLSDDVYSFYSCVYATVESVSEENLLNELVNKYRLYGLDYRIENLGEGGNDKYYLVVGEDYYKIVIEIENFQEILNSFPNEYNLLLTKNIKTLDGYDIRNIAYDDIDYDFGKHQEYISISINNSKYYLNYRGFSKEITVHYPEVNIPNLEEIITDVKNQIDVITYNVSKVYIIDLEDDIFDLEKANSLLNEYGLKLGHSLGGAGGPFSCIAVYKVMYNNIYVGNIMFLADVNTNVYVTKTDNIELVKKIIENTYDFGTYPYQIEYNDGEYLLKVEDNYYYDSLNIIQVEGEIELSIPTKELYTNEMVSVITEYSPVGEIITYGSSDSNVASISDGVVKAINAGTTTISAALSNGKASKIILTIKNAINDFDKNIVSVISSNIIKTFNFNRDYSSIIKPFASKGIITNHLDKSGVLVTRNKMYTGDKLNLIRNGYIINVITIAISGDVNCDGMITPLDYVAIKNHIMNYNVLKDDYIIASADVNDDNNITPLDYVAIKNHIMNGGN